MLASQAMPGLPIGIDDSFVRSTIRTGYLLASRRSGLLVKPERWHIRPGFYPGFECISLLLGPGTLIYQLLKSSVQGLLPKSTLGLLEGILKVCLADAQTFGNACG
jgi:hypothetical protein